MTDMTQLPWFSFSEGSLPPKSARRRRRKPTPQSSSAPVELPPREDAAPVAETSRVEETQQPLHDPITSAEPTPAFPSLETPTTSYDPSDTDSTQATTPSSAAVPAVIQTRPSHPAKSAHCPRASITTIVPAIPNLPLSSRPSRRPPASSTSDATRPAEAQPSNADHVANVVDIAVQAKSDDVSKATEQSTPTSSPPAKEAPKSWADLVRTAAAPTSAKTNVEANVVASTNGFANSKTTSLSEALSTYSVAEVKESSRIAFLEPRGLVNIGNMCYMNSVDSSWETVIWIFS